MIYPILGGLLLAVNPFHWAPPPHQQVSPARSIGDRNFVDCWVLHPSYYHQYPCWWWCDGKKHNLSGRDTREQSNCCTAPRRSSILGAGSCRPFWFDHFFRGMIFGQEMAKIRHGGGSRTVVFRPFWEVVRCGLLFLVVTYAGGPKKKGASFFTSASFLGAAICYPSEIIY